MSSGGTTSGGMLPSVDWMGARAPVVVGCSGGADSLALLVLALDADLGPVAVHVDHGLRPESARAATTCRDLVGTLGAQGVIVPVAIPTGPNLEARARRARYAALEQARRESDATAVLVAHTADDQAETVLVNLLRGGARTGLGGMPSRRGHVVRPLLGWRRTDTAALCRERGLTPIEDPTNRDPAFVRNRVRHELLPVLCRVAHRDVVPVIARQAALLRRESDYLDELARSLLTTLRVDGGALDARRLLLAPDVLARRALRQWLGDPPPSASDIERVLAVARGERVGTQLAGRGEVRRRAGALHREVPCAS